MTCFAIRLTLSTSPAIPPAKQLGSGAHLTEYTNNKANRFNQSLFHYLAARLVRGVLESHC